jgi:hypothetical protein
VPETKAIINNPAISFPVEKLGGLDRLSPPVAK